MWQKAVALGKKNMQPKGMAPGKENMWPKAGALGTHTDGRHYGSIHAVTQLASK